MNDKWRKDEDLDPRLKKLLQSLPRDKQPSPELLEALVAQLRRDGVVREADESRDARARKPATSPASTAGGFQLSWARAVWQVAAAIVVFAFGVGIGRITIDRANVRPPAADSIGVAASIQSTGTAHVNALAWLAESSASLEPGEREQAREVALAAFHAAAAELVWIAPDELMTTFAIAGLGQGDVEAVSQEPRSDDDS